MKSSLYVPKNTSKSTLESIIVNVINENGGGSVSLAADNTWTGTQTFSTAPVISTITNTGTLTLPATTGTLALTSEIPTNSNYADLTTDQTIGGIKTFSSAPVISSISNIGTLTLPTTTGTLALVSEIPDTSNVLAEDAAQNVQNKSFIISSNTSIASVAANTFTTTAAHNLLAGDTMKFPVVGSLTGVVAGTIYTVQTATTNTFTINATVAGTVGTAYYIIVSRALANQATAGGSFVIDDASNLNNGIYFDASTATSPLVIQSLAVSGAARFTIPTFSGTAAVLGNTQTFNGAKTFSAGLINSRAGQTVSTSAGFLSSPATTAMTGTNSYFFNYFTAPASSGTTTGTSSTVVIAGQTTSASNNYNLQLLAGQTSYPLGTIAAPSLIFANNKTSGIYSSAANVINTSISGVNVHQVSSTGLTIAGITQSSTSMVTPLLRPVTGNLIQSCPATDSTTGTAQLRISPTSGTWATNGVAELQLGDGLHYIRATNSFGMYLFDTNAINFATTNYYNFADNGSTSYLTYGAGGSDPIGAALYGLSFGSGASGKALNIYNDSFACVKLGTNADRQIMAFFRTPSGQVGSISVTSAATAYNTVSDRRAKKNIRKIKERDGDSVIDQLKKLNIYEYEFNADDSFKSIGFIADELKDVYPEAVTLGTTEDELDMIDYSRLVPILAAGLKDVVEEMEDLRKEIRKLKGE